MPSSPQRLIRSEFAPLLYAAGICLAGLIVPGRVQAQAGTPTGGSVVDSIFNEAGGDTWIQQTQVTSPGTPPGTPAAQQPSMAQQQRRPLPRSAYPRLARVPNMFGDSIVPAGRLLVAPVSQAPTFVDLPLAGGSRRSKFAENNKGLPMDRVFFMYNHFENAFEVDTTTAGVRDYDVDRYTLGLEKTFFDERTSIDVRLPLTRRFGFTGPFVDATGGEVGNLAITLKALLYESDDETFALGGGLAIDTPTGSDVDVRAFGGEVTVENRAFHLLPFLSLLVAPDDNWFIQSSMQFDFATNGNPISVDQQQFGGLPRRGVLTDQTLMYVDLSVGRWLYRNDESDWFQGLAGLVELHYTTSLQDSDQVVFAGRGSTFVFSNPANRFDFLNMTIGLQAQFDELTNLRVGGVFPLRSGFDRGFDAEVQVSVNRHY